MLYPNPAQAGLLYEEKLQALRDGYRTHASAIPPIVAVRTGADSAMIIEGHHRFVVAQELGIEPAVIVISRARLRRYNREGLSWEDIEYDVQRRARRAEALRQERRVER